MKQSSGVLCNGAQGSKESQPCLSLWLSLYLNLPSNWWWGSGGHAALMEILHISRSIFLLSFLPIFLNPFLYFYLCSHLCSLCVCGSLKLSSVTVFSPRGLVDSYPPSQSHRLHWQSLTARVQPFTLHCYQQWGSCKQRPLLSAYLLSQTIWITLTTRQQQCLSCRCHLKRIHHWSNIISAALHIKHEPPLI